MYREPVAGLLLNDGKGQTNILPTTAPEEPIGGGPPPQPLARERPIRRTGPLFVKRP